MLLSRVLYYLASIPRMLRGLRNWSSLLALLFGLPISRPAMLELTETGLRFRVRSALEAWLIKEVCIDRQYEAASVAIQNGWTVIDIGAGIGEFAIDVAKRHPDCRVLAYEPAPETFARLQENIALNGIRNVNAFPYAAAARPGHIEMRLHPSQAPLTSTRGTGSSVRVPAVTLDGILEQNEISRGDYLKIDCEGCEFEILLGASIETLSRIGAICLEFHDYLTTHTHEELTTHLRGRGFEVSIFPSPVHRGLGLLAAIRREPAS